MPWTERTKLQLLRLLLLQSAMRQRLRAPLLHVTPLPAKEARGALCKLDLHGTGSGASVSNS
jgi:hypothetical protein